MIYTRTTSQSRQRRKEEGCYSLRINDPFRKDPWGWKLLSLGRDRWMTPLIKEALDLHSAHRKFMDCSWLPLKLQRDVSNGHGAVGVHFELLRPLSRPSKALSPPLPQKPCVSVKEPGRPPDPRPTLTHTEPSVVEHRSSPRESRLIPKRLSRHTIRK